MAKLQNTQWEKDQSARIKKLENDLTQQNINIRIMQRCATVMLGRFSPQKRKIFRCSYCHKRLFDYCSDIDAIVIMGEMHDVYRPIDVMCTSSKCKAIHRIAYLV